MNVWPATLPQRFSVSGYQESMGDGRLRSQNDAGTAKVRRRVSRAPRPITATVSMLTEAQTEILADFVRDDLKDGVLPFQIPAQRGGGTWIVQIAQDMPAFVPQSGLVWQISLSLVILP